MSVTNSFQFTAKIKMPNGTGGQNGGFQVPAGKRLVIEYASGEAFAPTGQKCLFSIFTSLAGQRAASATIWRSTLLGKFGARTTSAPDWWAGG